MTIRIAFGIVTAKESPAAVLQLIDLIGPQHRVVIHHDFSKQANFRIRRPNVRFIEDPRVTRWGDWSFCEAILMTMRAAMAMGSFDYFQLLSGTCLPIKPIAAFENFVGKSTSDVNMDMMCLDEDVEAMMSHGFRMFARDKSLRQRLLRRTRRWYYGERPETAQRSGLGIQTRNESDRSEKLPPRAQVALLLMQMARRGFMFDHPYGNTWLPYIGSTWFGCQPAVCDYIARRDPAAPTLDFMRDASLADELYFQTLVGNSPFSIGPSNHLINDFDDCHPRLFGLDDLPKLDHCGKYFARKFANDSDCDIRHNIIGRVTAVHA